MKLPGAPDEERRIFVVIPVRNRLPLTRACLASLAAQTVPHTVVVVDDGSTDGTSGMIRSDFPATVLLLGDGGLWWTRAINIGVAWALSRCADDDLVVTLNDDTSCPPDYLANLVKPTVPGSRMLLGSVATSHRRPGVVVDGGVLVDWWKGRFIGQHRGESLDMAFPDQRLRDVDVLPGRGTLVPAKAFRELGPYDARHLPHYAADYEFARRAARAGYRVAINPAAVLVVREESSGLHVCIDQGRLDVLLRSFVDRRSANNVGARWHFARLSAPRAAFLPFLAADLGRVLLGSVRRFITGRRLRREVD